MDEFIDGHGTAGNVILYDCGADVNCVAPTPVTSTTWEGFSVRVQEILFGPGGNDGLLHKMRQGNLALTAQEQAFLTSAFGPVQSLMRSAVQSEGSLESLGAELQSTIATTMAQQLVMELIFAVEKSFVADNVPMGAAMATKLSDRQEEFALRTGRVRAEVDLLNTVMQMRGMVVQEMALLQGMAQAE